MSEKINYESFFLQKWFTDPHAININSLWIKQHVWAFYIHNEMHMKMS
jgi:hypothetical protein